MVHQHGLSHHLVRRQRGRHDVLEEIENDIETVVVTMPNTFTGDVVWVTQTQPQRTVDAPQPTKADKPDEEPKTLLPPATREPEPSSTARKTSTDEEESAKPTTSPKASSTRPSILTASTFAPLSSTIALASTSISGLTAATSSSSPSPSPSASSEAAASSGMSGGAKAGLALGVLCAIGALLGAILFVYHRKKKQMTQEKVDDEKFSMRETLPPPPPPHHDPEPERAPSIRTERTMSTAPRLSLRPLTQFDPMFPNRKSNGNMLDVATAGAVADAGDRSPSSDRPGTSYSWERPGANNASSAPVNPFNDPQPRSVSPLQDPFSNSAAIETSQASPKADFGNPAPAIAAAEAATLMAALPSPPSHKNDSVPPSPAWTEDIPASPGPAPSGPLPVAAAGGAAPPPNNVHRVQLDFKPSMSDELGLRAGQLVRMLHEYDDGWALCVRMDRSQQGVVPRTCLSKHPVKPRQGPPGPRMRGPPTSPPMAQGVPQPRPLSPASGRSSPHPPSLSPANGRMSPAPRSMSPGPRQLSPPQGRARSNSNAPYAGGSQMAPPPQMGRPRANSAGQPTGRRQPQPGPSRMNPNPAAHNGNGPMPHRKPLPGQAL